MLNNLNKGNTMLTKKHFNELVKIHAEALKEANQNNFKAAYSIFEFKLRDYYSESNSNFDDVKFQGQTQKLAESL